jgi:hypothetical protein
LAVNILARQDVLPSVQFRHNPTEA